MSTTRVLRSFASRTRLPAAPRQLRTRQRPHHPQGPKKVGGRFNSLAILRFFTFVGLGWGANEIIHGQWSGNALKPKSSLGPHILAQIIDNPRLPKYEESQVRNDRAVAERKLLENYPSDEYKVVLDAGLPGDYYYDPYDPLEDHDNFDDSSIAAQPVALYRVERADLRISKGKTVALLLYAHPSANLSLSALALKMQTIVQAMDDAGEFAMNLRGESLTTFTQRGEWIETLTWRSIPRS